MNSNGVLLKRPCLKDVVDAETGLSHKCLGIVMIKEIDKKNHISGNCIGQCIRCKSWYETWQDLRVLKNAV
jgi:hypothetical protein